jgi:hypothetical protein
VPFWSVQTLVVQPKRLSFQENVLPLLERNGLREKSGSTRRVKESQRLQAREQCGATVG